MNQVALIAGMGPDAGADVLLRFLAACRGEVRAGGRPVTDQGYPPHVLVQYPVPDRTAALLQGGESPVPELVSAFGAARASGARVMGIACNTAHFWHAELRQLFPDLHILHIAQETARAAREAGARRCGVLATAATLQGGLYADALADAGLESVRLAPADEAAIHRAIFEIKAGRLEAGRAIVMPRLKALLTEAEAVILGCTELGLVVDAAGFGARVIDAASVLARSLAAKAYGTYVPGEPPPGGPSGASYETAPPAKKPFPSSSTPTHLLEFQ